MSDAQTPVASDQPTRGPDYERLLSLLELAEKGSRELDWSVHAAITNAPDIAAIDWYCPHYTSSIDAALTLVPEGWSFVIHGPWEPSPEAFPPPQGYFANIAPKMPDAWGDDDCDPWEGKTDHLGRTPALALCIAALRARSAA